MTGDAPLIVTPDAPVPDGGAAAWVLGAGGVRLRAALFPARGLAAGTARGSIILSGGRTEPIEKYFEVIAELQAQGFTVLAHDWRGQGLSARLTDDRLAGHAAGFDDFLTDFRLVLDAYASRLPKPWIGVGHSMGGCLTLLAMAKGETRLSGAILTAPMLGIALGRTPLAVARLVAAIQVRLGRGGRYASTTGDPFYRQFDGNPLTHDRGRYERCAALLAAQPDLALGPPTWGWLDFAFGATAYLRRPGNLRSVTAPVVILSAENDTVVDNAAQAATARNLPQGQFVNVPGALHEILMETDEMRSFFQKVLDALTGRVAPEEPVTAPAKVSDASAPPTQAEAAVAAAAAPTPIAVAAEVPVPPSTPVADAVVKAPAPKPPASKSPAPKKASPKAAAVKKPAAAKAPAAPKPAPTSPVTVASKPAAKAAPAKPAPAKAAAPAAKSPAAKSTAAKGAPTKAATPKAPAKAAPVAAPAKATPAAKAEAAKPAASKAAAPKTADVKKPAAAKAAPKAKAAPVAKSSKAPAKAKVAAAPAKAAPVKKAPAKKTAKSG